MLFELKAPKGRPDQPLPDFVRRDSLTNVKDRVEAKGDGLLPLPGINPQMPVPELGSVAAGIGHLNVRLDVDGAVRTEPLVIRYFDELYPSFALMVAARALNLAPKDIEVRLGEGVAMGDVRNPHLTVAAHVHTVVPRQERRSGVRGGLLL